MDKQHCSNHACGGLIEDGFCNRCGIEPISAITSVGTYTPAASGTYRANPTGTATLSRTQPPVWNSQTGSVGSVGTGHSTRRGTSRRSSTRRSGSSHRQLGLGLVQIPEMPALDPATVVMSEQVVPTNKRFCPGCNEPLKREKGFCPKCGNPYCFTPALVAGDVVAGQYEVIGAIAFGGLGWIYLAKDTALSRWVVLKGLLNAQDEAAAAAAVAERQFLAAVKHPNIVGVYNFVQRGTEGYIVMEYVGGKTLKTIRKERGPLPVTEAIAYIHRILGAFAYLHRHEPTLVYCDFKPDNFMVEGDDVKLIDMGGVRLVDDPGGDIYGTRGYSAPEAGDGPTIVTDLYTVARTLVVLIIDFRGYQNSYEFTLPSPEEQPIFAKHESLYRLLLKATRKDPDERFQSADEMASQLAGVLREIVAIETATPRPSDSSLFGGESPAGQDGSTPAGAALLPALKVDASDPAAQYILSNVGHTKDKRLGIYSLAVARFPNSIEAKLRLANSQIECGDFHKADNLLTELEIADPFDWRVTWTRALAQFTLGNASAAAALFNLIYSELPGELAPKLALALAADVAGEKAAAIQFYDMVSLADPNFTSAIFGLGRCLAETGFRPESIAAYARVPASSSAYTRAQIATARTWLLSTAAGDPTPEDIHRAWETIEALALDALQHHQLVLEILQKALVIIEAGTVTTGSPLRIFGKSLYPGPLRKGMEEALRTIARLVENPDERINLIDLANQVRPVSIV